MDSLIYKNTDFNLLSHTPRDINQQNSGHRRSERWRLEPNTRLNMKKSPLQWCSGLKYGALLACATTLFTSAQAQVIFSDDFESGVSGTTWTAQGGLWVDDTTRSKIGSHSAKTTTSGARMSHPVSYVNSTTAKISFWFYDGLGAGASKQMAGIYTWAGGTWGVGGAPEICTAGKNNSGVDWTTNSVTEAVDTSKYQGRFTRSTSNGDTPGGAGYFNLIGPGVPSRTVGWHKFDIIRGLDDDSNVTVTFYLDGVVSRSFTNTSAAWGNTPWNFAVVGLGAGTTVEDDNVDGYTLLNGQPYISTQPTGATVKEGIPLTVTAHAIGNSTLSYQWKKNGANAVGQTTDTLSLPSPVPSDSGNYTLVVSNSLDVVTSKVAVVTINPSILITTQPESQIVNLGANATFTVVATSDTQPLFYQWRKNGTNIADATLTQYTITGVTTNDAASYTVVVSNGVDPSNTSSNAVLTVNTAPTITTGNQNVTLGKPLHIRLAATDDLASQATPIVDFETFANGTKSVMFAYPGFSGSTSAYIDNGTRTNFARITNGFPVGQASSNVLHVGFDFTGTSWPWIRLSTSNSGVTNKPNPIISAIRGFRFRAYADRTIAVCLLIRETNPTGAFGANGGTSGSGLEYIGSYNNQPYPYSTNSTGITIPGGTWTTMTFDMPRERVAAFGSGFGNGVLETTTGKVTLDSLALVGATDPGGSGGGAYNVYLDNFVVMPTNALSFAITDAPAGAAIDETTGDLSWTPPSAGTYNFTVTATDPWGMVGTKSFTVTVSNAAPPNISISRSGTDVVLNWTGTAVLQSATDVSGPYTDVAGPVTTGPYQIPPSGQTKFFRLRN